MMTKQQSENAALQEHIKNTEPDDADHATALYVQVSALEEKHAGEREALRIQHLDQTTSSPYAAADGSTEQRVSYVVSCC